MKKLFSLLLASMFSLTALPEQRMTVHSSVNGDTEYSVFNVRDISLDNGQFVMQSEDSLQAPVSFDLQDIDSLTFNDPVSSDYVQILYAGDFVDVINPFSGDGVEVNVSGANVEVTTTTDKYVTFYLKGSSLDGSLTITPSAKFAMLMDNLVLANMSGPAIKVLEDFRANITLADGSKNALVGLGDGVEYNAAFWSKTQLVFCPEQDENGEDLVDGDKGTGYLGVSSLSGHGIYSKDYIRMKSGEIDLSDVAGDGINSKDYFRMDGGSLSISAKGDAIDCNDFIRLYGGSVKVTSETEDVVALKADSSIVIRGTDLDIFMSGNGARGIKSDASDVMVDSSKVRIELTGGLFPEVDDVKYVTGIKAETVVFICGGSDVDITCGPKSTAAKGINAVLGIDILNSTVVAEVNGLRDYDAVSGGKVAGLKTDGDIFIKDSSVTIIAANLEESGVKAVNCANKDEIVGLYTEKTSR